MVVGCQLQEILAKRRPIIIDPQLPNSNQEFIENLHEKNRGYNPLPQRSVDQEQ